MTLILSLSTPDYTIQVADRRVTYQATGEVKNNYATKMVMLGNQMLFSFTGLATLEDESTDVWLARNIFYAPSRDLESVAEHIRRRAQQAILREAVRGVDRRYRRLAFVGVGYYPVPARGTVLPIAVRVSNFLRGHEQLAEAADEFRIEHEILLRPRQSGFMVAGSVIPPALRRGYFRRALRFRKGGTSVDLVIRLLCGLMRTVARTNPFVGEDVLCGFLARESVRFDNPVLVNGEGAGVSIMTRPEVIIPELGRIPPSFMDIPAGMAGTLCGPLMSYPGAAAVSGIVHRPGVSMEASFIELAPDVGWDVILLDTSSWPLLTHGHFGTA